MPTENSLLESDLAPSPLAQFDRWYKEALALPGPEPTAVTLATSTRDGIPSARTVLLKGVDARGFVFYTNYESHKARELLENPRAALLFYWPALARQVRVLGAVAKVDAGESDAYFKSRPAGSQIGAWASQQGAIISGRDELETRYAEVAREHGNGPIPRPPHWGGFRLVPTSFEFWAGRENRLHDRLRYTPRADGTWRIERLSP